MWVSILSQLSQGAMMTVKVSSLSVMIGFLGGVAMGVFSSQKMQISLVNPWVKSYVAVIRGTPLFIQLLIIYFAVPEITGIDISAFTAGVIALGCNSAAYIAEIVRCGINTLPIGQWDASYCLGYSPSQTLLYIVLPQTLRNVFPSITNEFVSLIKESSILMILGVQELTKVSKDIVSRELKPFEIYVITALMYFLLTAFVSMLSAKFERSKQ